MNVECVRFVEMRSNQELVRCTLKKMLQSFFSVRTNVRRIRSNSNVWHDVCVGPNDLKENKIIYTKVSIQRFHFYNKDENR